MQYDKQVFGAVDIAIEAYPGEIVAIVGPNGAGKSTTLNMLSGLLRPTSGTATVLGIPVTDVRRLATALGVALQTSGLDPSMTAAEHFMVQAALYRLPREVGVERMTTLLEKFGLTQYADRQISQFSVGLQRRLAVALALVHDPEVIILDEPTAGLDPQSRRVVRNLLSDLRREGRTILISTQLLEEADLLAQRVYVIVDGRVVADGTPEELRKQYGETALRIKVEGPSRVAFDALATGLRAPAVVRDEDDLVVVTGLDGLPDVQRVISTLSQAEIEVVELSMGRPSLEDAFVTLTGSLMKPEPLLTSGGPGSSFCRCG